MMRLCNTQMWDNTGIHRLSDCPEPSAWKVTFEDGEVSGYPCDKHVADYLHFDEPSTVVTLQEDTR
jgi:hypothetical protein